MSMVTKKHSKANRKATLGLAFCLSFASLFAVGLSIKENPVKVDAADYSVEGSGFTRTSDGGISATFTVTDNNLDERGWLLCLFDEKPAVDSNNKLIGSNDIHPYYEEHCIQYFSVTSGARMGKISVQWGYNLASQKGNWSISEEEAEEGYRLCDYLDNGTDWHIVIGPRHYNTSWGDSGYGAGTNGYWENCDYYIGSGSEVFPDTKDMSVSVTNYSGTYNNANHSISIKVNDPTSGYTIKYGTTQGTYNLTTKPEYKNAGNYTTYFQITAEGYNTYEGSGTVSIAKANPSYIAPYPKEDLTYTGSDQALVTAGSSNILYSLDGTNYSSNVPVGKNAGNYTVYYKIEESTNYKALGPVSLSVTITKAYPTYTAPQAMTGLIYDGSEQELVTAGTSSTSTLLYSLDGTNYSTTIPSAINAGTYTVYYKINETENYKAISPKTIEVSIGKANPVYTAPSGLSNLIYNGNDQALVTAGSSNILYSLDGTNYSSNVPVGKNAGEYTVYYKINESNNYLGLEPQTIEVSIAKANPVYTAPVALVDLVYNGDEQELINAGISSVSPILYSLDGENYSETIPNAVNAGLYTVYYKIDETENYLGLEPQVIEVAIGKANPVYTAPVALDDLVYNEENQALVTAGSNNILYSLDGENYYSDVPFGKNAGEYTVYYKIDESNNYLGLEPQTIEVSIGKADATYLATPAAKLGLNYIGVSQLLIEPGTSKGGKVLYSLDGEEYSEEIPERKLVGDYTVYYKIEGDDNYNGVDPEIIEVSIYPNDKTALNAVIEEAKAYHSNITSNYVEVALELNEAISIALIVSEDDNQTIEEIDDAKEALIAAYNLAHAKVTDILIENIGDVRYTDKCHDDIVAAEDAYTLLSLEQQALVLNHDDLAASRDLYDRLHAVVDVINAIGEVTYDSSCYNRILAAQNALNTLSSDEQLLIPTYLNNLYSAEDVYEALKIIDNLGEVEYMDEYKNKLEEARNVFDALDYNEQNAIYNYNELLNAEEKYNNVDNLVNLVNDIADNLEYVGTHEPNIDKAKNAYDSLSEEEKLLVPTSTYNTLTAKEEEYEELKVEHERKEVEDREAGVAIAIEGASGIPSTVSIDINNSQNKEENFEDNIDYQTISEIVKEDEVVSSICEVKFYDEVDGEMVEVSLEDIDENISIVVKIDVPEDVDPSNFKIVLLDKDNNMIEMEYTYNPETRQASVTSSKTGTFAIISTVQEPTVATEGLPGAIVGAVLVSTLIFGVAYLSIFKPKFIKVK